MGAIETSTTFTFTVDGLGSSTDVAQIEGEEGVSQLFQFNLLLVSDDHDIPFADVIGKPALLTLTSDGSEPRHVHGIVSRFAHGDSGKKQNGYRATLVPKVFRLHHRHDSRIFQEMTVPDIITKVLTTAGISGADFRLSMEKPHPVREYCVQYRESDLAFISRLMEEEGIYYFFEHSEGGHVMVIADGPGGVSPIAGQATIAHRTPLGAMAHGESVSRFVLSQEIRPGRVTLTDFNFKRPALSLLETKQAATDAELEIYDYPGEYELPGDGANLASVRLEEWQAGRQTGEGDSGCVRFVPGYSFTLSDHVRDSDNQAYLITRVFHRGGQAIMGEGSSGHQNSYLNTFNVIPSRVSYRPARRTPRPTVKGVQTAIVVGPAGEEIYTDEHGRVKVQFHWDRQGKKDEKSSCWIRVSQIWAGTAFGAMFIPRIGQEVIVDFIEGDPDRPIITGRVYHATNVPPYPLPAEKTKSTIKTNSSKGGGGSNELRFEDKKGDEEVYLHAEKDWNIVVKRDLDQQIGHDENHHVVHDRTMEVDHDLTETIGNDQTVDIAKNLSETVGADATLAVSGNRSVAVDGDHDEAVGGDQSVDIGKNQSISVGKNKSESVSGSSAETVSKSKSVTVDENFTLTVSKEGTIKIGKNLKTEVSEKSSIVVGKELSVQVGDASITVKKDGTITVQGKNITVKGSGPIKVEGQKLDVKTDGAVNIEASGNVKVKGSNVGVN